MKRKGLMLDLGLGICVVVAVVAALSMQDVRQQVKKTVTSAIPAPTPAKLYGVGEVAQVGAYSLAIKAAKFDVPVSRPYVLAAGYEYAVIDLAVKNTGKEPLEVAPALQVYLRDAMGSGYGMAPAPMDAPFRAGRLAPGEERSGQVSFVVARGAKGLRLAFDPNPAAAAPVAFSLGR